MDISLCTCREDDPSPDRTGPSVVTGNEGIYGKQKGELSPK